MELPSTAIKINVFAFSGYTKLTEIQVPSEVTEIGNNAFKDVVHIYYTGTAKGSPWGALMIN